MQLFSKLILCVTSEALLAGLWRFGSFQQVEKFTDTDQGKTAFKAFLNRFASVNTYLLVDMVEEDYRQELLPHLRGKDRRDLIARKLEQAYRKLDFRSAIFLRQEKDNRRNDRFLFFALNKSEQIDAWLAIINSAEVPLAGIYSLPMLSGVLLSNAKFAASHILLCEHLSSGFRQTYLDHGRVVLSRLSPYPLNENFSAVNLSIEFCLIEIEKSQSYLMSQRFIKHDDRLTIVMFSRLLDAEILAEKISARLNLDVQILSTEKKATLKNDALVLGKSTEFLYMHLLAKNTAKNLGNLAPKGWLKNYYLNQTRRYLHISTAVISFITLALTCFFIVQEQISQQEIKSLSIATNLQKIKYAQVAKIFPYAPYPSDQLLRVVNFYAQISQYQQTPQLALQVISQAINKMPEIQINRINWLQTPEVDAKDAEERAQNQIISNKNTSLVFPKNTLHPVVYVAGEVKHFNGDYRGALQLVNQVIDNLKKDVSVADVALFQAPVNVSSYSNLEGTTADAAENKQLSALFKIKLVLKQAEPKQ